MGKYFDWSQWRIQRGFHGFRPSFEGLPSTIYYAQTYLRIHYAHTGATHFSFKVAKSHLCQLNFLYQEFNACVAYVHV